MPDLPPRTDDIRDLIRILGIGTCLLRDCKTALPLPPRFGSALLIRRAGTPLTMTPERRARRVNLRNVGRAALPFLPVRSFLVNL
jgi:hypothetical protein